MPDYLQTAAGNFGRDRTGIRHFDITFVIPGPAEADGQEPYDILDTWAPAEGPLKLPETDRKAQKRTDGAWDLTLTYEGMPEGAKAVGFAEIDHAGAEDPIEMAENYAELMKTYNGKPQFLPDGGEKFGAWITPWKDPSTGKMIRNPMLGTTHFLNDTPVLRITFAWPKYIPGLLKNICKIDTPVVPEGQSQLRETVDNKTWLKRSVRMHFLGNVWKYEIEYLLGKWVPLLYQPKIAAPVAIPEFVTAMREGSLG